MKKQLLLEKISKQEIKKHIKDFYKYAKKRLDIDKSPKIKFVKDPDNAEDFFGKTGFYDPESMTINLFITDRHAKDIVRSFAHELIHHYQNLNEKLPAETMKKTHDIDWGDYPYVTSSHCTVGSAILNGIAPQSISKIFGIMKAYETYSGFKTTFQDENDPILQQIQEVGGEFGATTGRKRKVRWLDLDGVIKAININGVTDLIINKADVLEKVGTFKYVFNNKLIECDSLVNFQDRVEQILNKNTEVIHIIWSMTPNGI